MGADARTDDGGGGRGESPGQARSSTPCNNGNATSTTCPAPGGSVRLDCAVEVAGDVKTPSPARAGGAAELVGERAAKAATLWVSK